MIPSAGVPSCSLGQGAHRLKDVLWDSRRLYLIMEYLDYDLQEYMAANKPLLPASEIKVGMQARRLFYKQHRSD